MEITKKANLLTSGEYLFKFLYIFSLRIQLQKFSVFKNYLDGSPSSLSYVVAILDIIRVACADILFAVFIPHPPRF